MKKILLALAKKAVVKFFKRLGRLVWVNFWDKVKFCIRKAETDWVASGKGAEKLNFVKSQAVQYVKEMEKLSKFKKWALEEVIQFVIELTISDLNRSFGKNWVLKVDNLQKYLEKYIPAL